jgi:hypothetical protein
MARISEVIEEIMALDYNTTEDKKPVRNPFKAMKRLLVNFHRARVSGVLKDEGGAFILCKSINEVANHLEYERLRYEEKNAKQS